MPHRISRRAFLAVAGAGSATLVSTRELFGKDQIPTMLDHILLGSRDLDAGIAYLEQRSSVRAAFGGIHPGRGTRNALISLGEMHYLEVIAPDPQQTGAPDIYGLRALTEPRLIGWVVHVSSIAEKMGKLADAGMPFDGPVAGARNRPDGGMLQWKALRLKDDRHGLLPFFIEWGAGSVHPSVDAPKGCRLVRFEAATHEVSELRDTFATLGIDVHVAKGDRIELRATFAGLRGEFTLTS